MNPAGQAILFLIPQRHPFVMIDKLLYSNESATCCSFKIISENIFVEQGKFLEAGLMENIAQTAAAREGYISVMKNKPVRTGYIGSIKNLEIFFLPEVNSELITEIKIQQQVLNATIITGKIFHNQNLIAQCEIKIFIDDEKSLI